MATGTTGLFGNTRLATGSIVLGFLTVQVLAFAVTYVAGVPTAYAVIAIASAAGVAYFAESGVFGIATAALGAVLLVAIGLPLFMFVARQSPAAIADRAVDPAVHRALYIGIYGPLLAAAVSVAFGVPLAWQLSKGFAGQPLIESLVDLPLVVPHSVAGLIVLFGFGKGGAFPQLEMLGTLTGMVIALTFVSAPYAVNAAREAFEAVDPRMEYAARIHGASEFETFKRVTAPLAFRGILTGGVLAWARSVSEFGAVAIVAYSVRFFYPPAGREVTAYHAPVFVYKTYLSGGLVQSGAVAFLLLLVATVIFLAIRMVALTDNRGVV